MSVEVAKIPTTSDPTTSTTRTPIPAGITKGRNVSGRSWKHNSSQCQKASNLVTKVKNSAFSKSWKKKQEERALRKQVLEMEKEIKESKKEEIREKHERRLEQEKRRMENEFKQSSRSAKTLNYNTASLKMKAMNKKQLRQIKKTRMNTKTGVVEYVSPYAK